VTARPDVLFTPEQIARRIAELGPEIARAFGSREICVVGLMKSCLVFMADLIRAIPLEMSVHFLRVTAIREDGGASSRTEIMYEASIPYEGRDILVLDDIVDTGITLSFLLEHIREHKPRSLKVCALVDKPGERKIDVHPNWSVFTLADPPADRFIVGYGLDYSESYRGLPYIGTIPRPAAPVGARKINLSFEGQGGRPTDLEDLRS
jgi:hypoxanthine phosphoribosyltransferase